MISEKSVVFLLIFPLIIYNLPGSISGFKSGRMEFDIDVCGEDIFSRDYTIVIAGKSGIKGFKLSNKLIGVLRAKQARGFYRYPNSKKGKSLFRVRVYCIVIYYLFKSMNFKNTELILNICKDFQGHEKDITSNLRFFLENILDLHLSIRYVTLRDSNAHRHAYLMRKDTKNRMKGYVKISLEEIEKYLIRK
ncbi:MAG: hypothetical protein V1645_00055 [archaeon]